MNKAGIIQDKELRARIDRCKKWHKDNGTVWQEWADKNKVPWFAVRDVINYKAMGIRGVRRQVMVKLGIRPASKEETPVFYEEENKQAVG